MREHIESLREKIVIHTARVAVVGMGYVGLPFAVEKAKVGFRVLGIDPNPNVYVFVSHCRLVLLIDCVQ